MFTQYGTSVIGITVDVKWISMHILVKENYALVSIPFFLMSYSWYNDLYQSTLFSGRGAHLYHREWGPILSLLNGI